MERISKELELIKQYNQYIYDDVINNLNYLMLNGYYELFLKCFESYKDSNKDYLRWEKAFELILNGFMNSEYESLLSSLKDSELSDIDIKRLSILVSDEHNIYEIEDLYDFESLAQVKYNALKSCLQDIRLGKSIDEIKKNNPQISRSINNELDLLKELIYQKTYNINYEQANILLKSYGNGLNNVKGIDKSLIEMIDNIKKINSITDINVLKEIFDNAKLNELDFNYTIIERSLASSFQSIYSQTYFKPTQETLKGYMRNGIPVYEIDTEFFMNVYSLGGVFENNTQNYLEDWEQRKDLFISTSYIGNRNMNTCPIRNVCYGFSSFSSNDILDAGVSNLQISDTISPLNPQSNHKNIRTNKVNYFMPQQFLSESNQSQEMTDDGYKWNEMGYRRFDSDGKRIMPDYIVYFSNGEINQNDTVWKNSILASEQFKIPIVIINTKKINEYNSQHEPTEFEPQQQIFINIPELIDANKDLKRIFNSFSVPSNIFQSDEWETIKERYDYDELEPERKRFIEEEFIELLKQKNSALLAQENDKIEQSEFVEDKRIR